MNQQQVRCVLSESVFLVISSTIENIHLEEKPITNRLSNFTDKITLVMFRDEELRKQHKSFSRGMLRSFKETRLKFYHFSSLHKESKDPWCQHHKQPQPNKKSKLQKQLLVASKKQTACDHQNSLRFHSLAPDIALRLLRTMTGTAGHSPITRSLSAPTTTSCSLAEKSSFPEVDLTSNVLPRALNPLDPEPNTQKERRHQREEWLGAGADSWLNYLSIQ